MLVEAPRNLLVDRVEPQREVGGQHGRRVTLRRVVGVRHGTGARATLRLPLVRTGRAFRQLPFIAEQVAEEVVAPQIGRASCRERGCSRYGGGAGQMYGS